MIKKIYLFTDYFFPESNAPALRCYEHAKIWVKEGHEVVIVTCNPNFPDGKLYEGYDNKLIKSEKLEGIKIIRLWSFITPNRGFLLRVIDHISSGISFFLYSLKIPNSSYVIATSPQFMTLIAIYFSSFFKRWKFIPEIRDMWPEGIIFLKKDFLLYKFLEFLEIKIYRKAYKIICVTKSFQKSISKRAKIENNKFILSYNGSNNSLYKEITDDQSYFIKKFSEQVKGKIIIGYAGTVGISHGLENIVDYINKLNLKNFVFFFVGSGAKFQTIKDNSQFSENIFVHEKIDQSRMLDFYEFIDFSLISLISSISFNNIPFLDKIFFIKYL